MTITAEKIKPSSSLITDSRSFEKSIPTSINEFWTSRQRQASSLHEISYRACFKPQLPKFFIEQYTKPNDVVYDPFMGRGTTVIEAGLLGRKVMGNDVNPICTILTEPRLKIPTIADVERRLEAITFSSTTTAEIDLSMFFHHKTLGELVSLKRYLARKKKLENEDSLDQWIRMVATNRLTGHSRGFFSVYTLPPNQATSQESQKKINKIRKQKPEYRDIKALILKKTRSLLRNVTADQIKTIHAVGETARLTSQSAHRTSHIPSNSVQLTVTSPPFLDVVQYSKDNWLRCWFNDIDDQKVARNITMSRTIKDWSVEMSKVFTELFRVTKPRGYVAFEVGEVRKGTVQLEETVIPLGMHAGFTCKAVLINQQSFTKTANIWGISNNKAGTNTNRIVLFQK